jgi:superkiller protein 3
VRPGYVAALTALAALDRAAGLPVALERYAKLLELVPDDADARRNYGELLSDAGELVHAQEELQKVVAAAPGDLRARRSLALVLAARRAGPELVADLEEIVKLEPEDMDARMDLAASYVSIAKMTEAEAVYDEVLRRKPRHGAALKLAGDLARKRGDVKKAAELYGKLRWVSPQDPRPVFLLGAAQYEAGNLEAAERMFSEGARFPGMMGEAYSNLGAIALRRGNVKEALWLLSRATKRRPGKATVRYNYAMALYGENRHADALNELRTAAMLDPADSGVRFFAGVVELRLGLLHEAEESFREALRLDPRNEDARHNLALLEPLVRPRREGSLTFGSEGGGAIPLEVAPRPAPDPAPAVEKQ